MSTSSSHSRKKKKKTCLSLLCEIWSCHWQIFYSLFIFFFSIKVGGGCTKWGGQFLSFSDLIIILLLWLLLHFCTCSHGKRDIQCPSSEPGCSLLLSRCTKASHLEICDWIHVASFCFWNNQNRPFTQHTYIGTVFKSHWYHLLGPCLR